MRGGKQGEQRYQTNQYIQRDVADEGENSPA